MGGVSADEVVSFILDVAVYSYRKDVRCRVGATIPETELMSVEWGPKALRIDELRGEPEELSVLSVGDQRVELLWLSGLEY